MESWTFLLAILNKMYDYIIVGAGLTGALYAYFLKQKYNVLVVEKQDHIGGYLYTEEIEGIVVHKYGPHIFHTNEKKVWDFMQQFSEFNNYIHSPKIMSEDKLYSLPFNMNTFNEVFGVSKPADAKNIILQESADITSINSLRDQAIKMVGKTFYNKFIKGYTEKQWGKPCENLPPSIISRIPVRYTYNNNYFDSKDQGIPKNGYTQIINSMLEGVEVILNCDYNKNREFFNKKANKIIYTGAIDELCDYQFGKLEYRSVSFKTEILDMDNFQGISQINYNDIDIPFTRIIEHKFFDPENNSPKTVITKEYSNSNGNPAYPINTQENNQLYSKYLEIIPANIILRGRLAEYKYYDMDKIVLKVMDEFNE